MKVAPVVRRRRAILNIDKYPQYKWSNLNIKVFMGELRKSEG